MKTILTVLCAVTVVADGFLVFGLAHLFSEMGHGCATVTGFALDRLTTTVIFTAPVVVACAVVVHLGRNRLNRMCQWLAFLPWGMGVVLAVTSRLVPALMRMTR